MRDLPEAARLDRAFEAPGNRYPEFWIIHNEQEGQRALVAADHANSATKNTKIIRVGDKVAGLAESFVGEPKDFEKVFSRSLSALTYGVDQFGTKMAELKTGSAVAAND